MMEDKEISDDDGFSFGSDITVEPDEDSQSSHRQIPRRIRWGPEVNETDEGGSVGYGGGNGNKNSRVFHTNFSPSPPPPIMPSIPSMPPPPLPPPPQPTTNNHNIPADSLNQGRRNGGGDQRVVDMEERQGRDGGGNSSPSRTIDEGVIAPGTTTTNGETETVAETIAGPTNDGLLNRLNISGNGPSTSMWTHFFRICLQLLPAFCFTCVLQFVDLMDLTVHLFLVGLVIFQAMFWPSIAFIGYNEMRRFYPASDGQNRPPSKIFSSLLPCSNGRWINTVLLEVHGLIVMGATLLQLLSIQYLDITVSLTLSFLSIIILVLLQHIIHEKKCSIELITTSILGYTGVILVTIPSVLAPHPYTQSLIYNGVAASIGSTLLTIQSAFLLVYLRKQNMDESLILSSVGLNGTLLCVIAGGAMKVLGPVNRSNGAYIASIVLFAMLGVTLILVIKEKAHQGGGGGGIGRGTISLVRGQNKKIDQSAAQNGDTSRPFISVWKLRVTIFLFCCFWGIFKQFYRQSFPTVYSFIGVTLILISFLFTMGFREWYAIMKIQRAAAAENERRGNSTGASEDDMSISTNTMEQSKEEPIIQGGGGSSSTRRRTTRFEFIPWLFTREPILYLSR